MTGNIKYIISYTEGLLSKRKMKEFERDLEINTELRQEYRNFTWINETLRGKADLEEVRNDPALKDIDELVKGMISRYQQNPEKFKDSRKFVKDTLEKKITGRGPVDETKQIQFEIDDLNLDEISGGWVKEWLEKGSKDPASEKNRDFIKQELKTGKKKSVLKIVHAGKTKWKESVLLRVTGLSAAVLIAGVILIKTLVPSDNPSSLYAEFYKPMNIISPVTRGYNSVLSQKFASAIELYRQGNYKLAASLFETIRQEDNSLLAPYFFQGITEMELGNYSQAVSRLTFVTSHPREYVKEAQWYLGLSYLKTGEKSKAISCFEKLSQSEGYYQDQAKKLLRRLK